MVASPAAVLVRLSATYYDQARFDRGIEAYSLLLQINPSDKRAPAYQLAIARGYMALDNFAKALEAYQALAVGYSKRSTWASQQADPELVSETHALVERALREYRGRPATIPAPLSDSNVQTA